ASIAAQYPPFHVSANPKLYQTFELIEVPPSKIQFSIISYPGEFFLISLFYYPIPLIIIAIVSVTNPPSRIRNRALSFMEYNVGRLGLKEIIFADVQKFVPLKDTL
ncbi:MAG: hypothetical protein EZS28_029535, partial [Streblomastix strix]